MTLRRAYRRATRVVRGELHTAVQTWVRQPDHTIVLVGMSHVGELSYFRTIAQVVAAYPGATVHYERLVREDPPPPTTEREWTRLERARRSNSRVMRWAAAIADLDTQSNLVVEGWHNVDVTEVDLVRVWGRRGLAWSRLPEPQVPADHEPALTERQRRALGHLVRFLLVHIAPWGRLLMSPMARRTVIHWRNVHAISQALRAVHDGPVVLIWGAGHLAWHERIAEAQRLPARIGALGEGSRPNTTGRREG